jgi:outer membrane protein insertion porin family/translocation and assembly module TamA
MTGRRALRAATFALFATAVSVAAPASLRAQDLTCDRGDQEVRALEFRGNRAMSDDDLALRVRTTPSSWGRRNLNLWFAEKRCLNHDELPRDVLGLKAYYRQRGFYAAQVDTLVEPLGKDAVRVVFNIDEGPPTRLVSYTVTGLEGIRDSADIVNRLRLRPGQPFDLGLFVADMDTIVQRLRDAGYYRAGVVHGYDRDSTVARASITVLPGKRARFGEPVFQITAVEEDRSQELATPVVRRVLGISPGDLYSDRAIVDAQRNLFQLGTYRHIEVAPQPDSLQPPGDTIVVLAVRLSEDYMRQLDSEFGWATLDCGRVRLQYTDKNLLGTARRLELTGQASKIGYGEPLQTKVTRDLCTFGRTSDLVLDPFSLDFHYFTGATIRQPRLLGTRWVPTVSLYSERRGEFRAYLRSTHVGGDLSAIRDVGDRMPLRLAYTFEYGQTTADPPALCALFNRCDPQSIDRIQLLLPLGVASAALARVRTDNLVSPTRGLAMRGELRTSASRALGTSDSLFFNKGTGDVAWYQPLGGRNVLAVRLRAGAVLGRRLTLSDRSGFIPPQERLYAGGPTSVRGFQQNELGSLVYIARGSDVDTIVVSETPAPGGGLDTTFRFQVRNTPNPDRAVPLGGNSLVVANFEYRIRDPFLFPDLVQYALFVDGGDVWTRSSRSRSLKWTPGVGIRALTPVGPIQINVGYNRYQRENGPIFYNPDVTTLLCVSPLNTLTYRRNPEGRLEPETAAPCDATFTPPPRLRMLQKLTFTFSIGSDF